jgi:PEP-CTERM motif
MIRLAKAFVFLAILAVGGAGAARAVEAEVDFGSLPLPSGCSTTLGDSGSVCGNSQVFTAAGNTFTAIGYDNPFILDDTSWLTLKPTGSNGLAESGLGENNTPPGTPCTSADCAIDRPFGVTVSASGNPIHDVIIGSFGEGDSFNLFTGSSVATMSFFDMFGGGGGGACAAASVAGTCLITFPDAAVIGIQTDTGSVLLTAVSATAGAVPEPSTWAMLLLGFAGLGFAGWRRAAKREAALA